MFSTSANLFNVWPNRSQLDSPYWIQSIMTPHVVLCLESPTTHYRENEWKGKMMSWCYHNTLYSATSQKGTLRWREQCGERQTFPDTWPKDALSSPLYYEVKWGARFQCPKSAKKKLCPPKHPPQSTIMRKDLCVAVASIKCLLPFTYINPRRAVNIQDTLF